MLPAWLSLLNRVQQWPTLTDWVRTQSSISNVHWFDMIWIDLIRFGLVCVKQSPYRREWHEFGMSVSILASLLAPVGTCLNNLLDWTYECPDQSDVGTWSASWQQYCTITRMFELFANDQVHVDRLLIESGTGVKFTINRLTHCGGSEFCAISVCCVMRRLRFGLCLIRDSWICLIDCCFVFVVWPGDVFGSWHAWLFVHILDNVNRWQMYGSPVSACALLKLWCVAR